MRPVAFTSGMTNWLGRLSACVIGVSGTGSIVAEQLARLGLGEIILIDFDKVVRDPASVDLLYQPFNCGDNIHPSPAGYLAMGKSVDLGLFRR